MSAFGETATETDLYNFGALQLDVGLVQFAPVRAGPNRLLVAMPRDALRHSSHSFPEAPSGEPAVSRVQMSDSEPVYIFYAVLEQTLFDSGVVFLIEDDALPPDLLQFDPDWGAMPLSDSLVNAAGLLGFFDVLGGGDPEAYLTCDDFQPASATPAHTPQPPALGGVYVADDGRPAAPPPAGRGALLPPAVLPTRAARGRGRARDGARGNGPPASSRPSLATVAPQVADLQAQVAALTRRLDGPPPGTQDVADPWSQVPNERLSQRDIDRLERVRRGDAPRRDLGAGVNSLFNAAPPGGGPPGGADLGMLRDLAGMGGARADGGLPGLLRRDPPAPGEHDGRALDDGGRADPPARRPRVAAAADLYDPGGADPRVRQHPGQDPQAGAAGTGLGDNMAALLRNQAQLLTQLAGGQAAQGGGLLQPDAPAFQGDPLRAGAGVRGIEALENLSRDFEARPRAYSQVIRQNAAKPLREPGRVDPGATMTNYCCRSMPWGDTPKGEIYMVYGICHALDLMHIGDWEAAEGLLHLLVAAQEAKCYDKGRWQLAWLLTFLEEPPWTLLAAAPAWDSIRPFGKLAPTALTTAATHYVKDAAALGELRKAKSGYQQQRNQQQQQQQQTPVPEANAGEGQEEGGGRGGRGRRARR